MFRRFLYILFVSIVISCSPRKRIEQVVQYGLADSNKLTHVKWQFYRDGNGYLFEKTVSLKGNGENLIEEEYFNGIIPQDLDPESFEWIDDGMYAKDKNYGYYGKPTSGGLQIIQMKDADIASLRLLDRRYGYGKDNRHVYVEGSVVDELNVADLQVLRDKDSQLIELRSGDIIHKVN